MVNLQTKINVGGRDGKEQETKEMMLEQWGTSEREEEPGWQKEEREGRVSRERREEKQ